MYYSEPLRVSLREHVASWPRRRCTLQGREPAFTPCTPLGCMQLLERVGIDAAGKRAVVVGRSNIVGMPAAMLLNKRDATVTICHSRTPVRAAHLAVRLARRAMQTCCLRGESAALHRSIAKCLRLACAAWRTAYGRAHQG